MARKKAAETQPAAEPIVETDNHKDMAPQDLSNMDPHPKEIAGEDVDVTRFNDTIRDEIAAKRREQLEKESALSAPIVAEEAAEKPAEEITETVAPSAKEVSPPSQTEENATETTAGSPQKKYALNINGQNVEYTEAELIAQAQRGVGAENKFREAAELRRQAEALMFATHQNLQPQNVVNNNTVKQDLQSPISNDALRDIAKRMNYGTEEDQVNALREAGELFSKSTGRAPGPTPEELVHIATQNALAVLDTRNEQQILAQEFPDIIADIPIAHATDLIANQLAYKYQSLGMVKTRVELLREAGTQARQKYLQNNVPPAQPNSSVQSATVNISNDKIERKRTAPQPPNAANKVASDPNAAYTVPSIQALEEMRRKSFQAIAKSRGQQAY